MDNRNRLNVAVLMVSVIVVPTLWAASDMPGSRDRPEFPRIEGATIYGYSHSDFDSAHRSEKRQPPGSD